jgi:hypothetical protein
MEPLTRDKKVEEFRLKPLPDLRKLRLGTGQYIAERKRPVVSAEIANDRFEY